MKKALSRAIATSAAFLGTAAPVLAQAPGARPTTNRVSITTPDGFATNFGSLLSGVLTIVMIIAALLVFFYLILGGIEWITSGGDKGKTESARNKITAAVIGLIVLAASYAILNLALSFLGFSGLEAVLNQPVNLTQ